MGSGAFRRALLQRQDAAGTSGSTDRRWLFVPPDQLSDAIGPLAREDPADMGIVLVENPWKSGRRPYHKQKLALLLANLRHFALEQAERGVAVRYIVAAGTYRETLEPFAHELGPLDVMDPAERELRRDLAPLQAAGLLRVLPHEGWMTTEDQFRESQGEPPYRMDAFYQHVRLDTGILMVDGSPEGGKYSFDTENRDPWRGEPPAPEAPTFPSDPVKDEVMVLVRDRFGHHPGTLTPESIPCTGRDAEELWSWAMTECMPHFGPYEDAMSAVSRGLFHTRISPLLNLHRLLPRRVVDDVVGTDAPLPSREGFVRQVLGWREFVRHVHRVTDGFRSLPGRSEEPETRPEPGDGGYGRWRGHPWVPVAAAGLDGGAAPSHLGGRDPLPPAWWGRESGLHCLDRVVTDVWQEGWSHHITRLMVLSNIATLLDVSPRELTDWFWAAYTDAYDWVVEPNVLGMGTFAIGPFMTTKPYVSGANYINRMGDYCEACVFDPKSDCPITELYWAFLARHEERLSEVSRMALMLASMRRRDDEAKARDRAVFDWVRDTLGAGERLEPADRPEPEE